MQGPFAPTISFRDPTISREENLQGTGRATDGSLIHQLSCNLGPHLGSQGREEVGHTPKLPQMMTQHIDLRILGMRAQVQGSMRRHGMVVTHNSPGSRAPQGLYGGEGRAEAF